MKILLATTNEDKIKNFKLCFSNIGLDIETLQDVGYKHRVSEDGNSFEVNSVVKAIEVASLYASKGYIVVADDGGIRFEDKAFDHDELHSHIKDMTPYEFNCDIINRMNSLIKFTKGESINSRNVTFVGAATVAYEDPADKMIHHKTVSGRSESIIRIMDIDVDDVPVANARYYYDIFERCYPDGCKFSLRNMSNMDLCITTGSFDIYNRCAYYIKDII